MPTREEILSGLTAIANQGRAVAIGWHVVLAAALIAAALGWRPRPRTTAALIALLPASAAGFAAAYGNPFNAILLGGLAIALVALGWRDLRGASPDAWMTWAGLAMIAYGWAYPHFLTGSPSRYVLEAPLGLVPCPSLSVAIGIALLGGPGGRAWRLVLAAAGAFYALFGVVRLGVTLDLGLLAGAFALAASALHLRARHAAAGRASR